MAAASNGGSTVELGSIGAVLDESDLPEGGEGGGGSGTGIFRIGERPRGRYDGQVVRDEDEMVVMVGVLLVVMMEMSIGGRERCEDGSEWCHTQIEACRKHGDAVCEMRMIMTSSNLQIADTMNNCLQVLVDMRFENPMLTRRTQPIMQKSDMDTCNRQHSILH